jgi:starch-binding outer membrane protein, SusD/RagB family
MSKLRLLPLLALLAVLPACLDLEVENFNAPGADQALANPADVETLVQSGFYRAWNGWQKDNPTLMISSAANDAQVSWGNWGAQDAGTVPRSSYDNSTTYGYQAAISSPWSNMYTGLSSMADGMQALNQGVNFGEGGANNARLEAWARFNQGHIHGILALMYDQAIIFDESIDLETADLTPVPYTEVMDAALGYLSDALAVAEQNTFVIPGGEDGWVHGRELTNVDLQEWIHSLKARFMANVARTPAERQAADWNQIAYHADRGVQAEVDGPTSDASIWWVHLVARGFPSWTRTNYDIIGLHDESGGYENWISTPWGDRTPFTLDTPDRRVMNPAADDPQSVEGRGTYQHHSQSWGHGCSPFPPERGTYFNSCYRNMRYHPWNDGVMAYFLRAEADLLKAEGHLYDNNIPAAVELINRTRVENGEMEPLDPNNTSMDEAWANLIYESGMELQFSWTGQRHFNARGWGHLVCGTPVHYPVPAGELELLEMPRYSFGGSVGGAAGDDGPCRDM